MCLLIDFEPRLAACSGQLHSTETQTSTWTEMLMLIVHLLNIRGGHWLLHEYIKECKFFGRLVNYMHESIACVPTSASAIQSCLVIA